MNGKQLFLLILALLIMAFIGWFTVALNRKIEDDKVIAFNSGYAFALKLEKLPESVGGY